MEKIMQANTDIRNIHNHIRILEKRYRNNLGSHLFFPLADAYTKAEMLDQAEIILREGLSKHPKYCAARALLGEIHFKKGNLKDAQQQLEEVVEMVPDNVMAHKLLLEVYKRIESKEKYEKEIEILQMIDQGEISNSYISQIEASSAGPHVETIKHNEESETLKAQVQDNVIKAERSSDLIQADAMENIAKNGAIQSNENDEGKNEIVTATLAELYFSQGFLKRSIDIYKKLLIQQPDHEKWAKRLVEIKEIKHKIEMDATDPPSEGVQHSEIENKKEKLLAVLEKWLENCQKIKKS